MSAANLTIQSKLQLVAGEQIYDNRYNQMYIVKSVYIGPAGGYDQEVAEVEYERRGTDFLKMDEIEYLIEMGQHQRKVAEAL